MIQTITLIPARISCPSIPGTMKGIVISLPGVTDVKVNYEERSLSITFDNDKLTPEKIIKEIGRETGLAMAIKTNNSSTNNNPDTCPL